MIDGRNVLNVKTSRFLGNGLLQKVLQMFTLIY